MAKQRQQTKPKREPSPSPERPCEHPITAAAAFLDSLPDSPPAARPKKKLDTARPAVAREGSGSQAGESAEPLPEAKERTPLDVVLDVLPKLSPSDRGYLSDQLRKAERADYRRVLFAANGMKESKANYIRLLADEDHVFENEDIPLVARAIEYYANKYDITLGYVPKGSTAPVSVHVTSGKAAGSKRRFIVRTADSEQTELVKPMSLPTLTPI